MTCFMAVLKAYDCANHSQSDVFVAVKYIVFVKIAKLRFPVSCRLELQDLT